MVEEDRRSAAPSGVPIVPRAPGRTVRRDDSYPGFALVGLIVVLYGLFALRDQNMAVWGVSAATIAAGDYQNLLLSMLAHGGLMHLGFNSMATLALLPPVIATLGHGSRAWFYAAVLLVACGLAGSAAFLAINPDGIIPAIGASGAIYGLVGYLARIRPGSGDTVPLFSRAMLAETGRFVRDNLVLVLLITVPIVLSGGSGGIAWEAHLGGFVAGLLLAPLFLAAVPQR